MCGICGYVGDVQDGQTLLTGMSDAMIHRGPDGEGFRLWSGGGVAHRRLSIIDRAGGHQPMVSRLGNVLSFNGEIYNYLELATELEAKGVQFSTKSDTEVLLKAYEVWGINCIDRFRGMFAFALWDDQNQVMHLVRDRIGIKPLYFIEQDGVFYFASEVKALLAVPAIQPRLNHEGLGQYLSFRYTPGQETLFEGIYKVEPGTRFAISKGGRVERHKYWQLPPGNRQVASQVELENQFWQIFQESIKLRTRSDVPFGAYLSGGLDSSLIVSALSREVGSVDTFSVAFSNQQFDESIYAEEVATYCDAVFHKLYADIATVDDLENIVYHLDEPLGDLAVIPTYLMSRETKEHVTVVLSGEGADELLAGYDKYKLMMRLEKIRHSALKPLSLLKRAFVATPKLARGLEFLGASERSSAYYTMSSVFSEFDLQGLLVDKGGARRAKEKAIESLRPYFSSSGDLLSQMLIADFNTWLPNDLLLKNDKMTMAHSIEARVPFLDHKLAEFCSGLHSDMKLKDGIDKYILRKVMEGKVPESISKRKKTGFSVPLADWLAGPMGERVKEVMSREYLMCQGLFNVDYIEKIKTRSLNDHFSRRQYWTLASFNLWLERFGVST